jgi:hypothetical protein
MSRHLEQLERDAEHTRAQIVATLDELNRRISPTHMLHEAVDYLRDGSGGQLVRNLGRQVSGNPLPVALAGISLAWLMMAGSRNGDGDGRGSMDRIAGDVGGAVSRAGAGVTAAVHDLRDWTTRKAAAAGAALGSEESGEQDHSADRNGDGNGDGLRDFAASASDRASSAYESVSRTAGEAAHEAARSGRAAIHSVESTSRSVLEFCKEQPLALVGLGLALGAAFGAAFRSTELESRLVGQASDAVKQGARAAAEEQIEKGRSVAESALDAAADAAAEDAERQGLTGAATSESSGAAAAGRGNGSTL